MTSEIISVNVTNGRFGVIEELDMKEQKEYFKELQTNGANPDIEKITWDEWMMPVRIRHEDIQIWNKKPHFIYGWWESFLQSDNVPQWLMGAESENVLIIVRRKERRNNDLRD